jgi:tRNA A-37 threonylcarbamoyl transferase component Bud32
MQSFNMKDVNRINNYETNIFDLDTHLQKANETCARINSALESFILYVKDPHFCRDQTSQVKQLLAMQPLSFKSSYESPTYVRQALSLEAPSLPSCSPSHPRLTESLSINNPTVNEEKVNRFCVEWLTKESIRNRAMLQEAVTLLEYPCSQDPQQLPLMTQEVALQVLTGKENPFNQITVGRVLGDGFNGDIHEVRVENNMYARKPISPSLDDSPDCEYQALLHLDHPNILKIAHADGDYLYTEYVQGMTLERASLSLKEALHVFSQLADALDHMHTRGYAHTDLHNENILITENKEVKLIDFGVSHQGTIKDLFFLQKSDIDKCILLLRDWIFNNEHRMSKEEFQTLEDSILNVYTSSHNTSLKQLKDTLQRLTS